MAGNPAAIHEIDPVTLDIVNYYPADPSFYMNGVKAGRKIVYFEPHGSFTIGVFDLDSRVFTNTTVTGDTTINKRENDGVARTCYNGMVYDEQSKSIYSWGFNNWAPTDTLWKIEPENGFMTTPLKIAGGPIQPTTNGMFGRVQILPEHRTIVILTEVDQNIRLVKLA